MPHVFDKIPNTRNTVKRIPTNRGSAAAWRAPRHPQNCFLTMSALADTAAALKMDELEFFTKNLDLTQRPDVYREEFEIAAKMIGYKEKAHARGDKRPAIKRGLGVSLHMGRPRSRLGMRRDHQPGRLGRSKDWFAGSRHWHAHGHRAGRRRHAGLAARCRQSRDWKNSLPKSGGSGGSTTIGGISTSSRLAATEALNALCGTVAGRLNTAAENLEAVGGAIRQVDKPDNKIAWKDACRAMGPMPITKRGTQTRNEGKAKGFTNEGVGGVQIAESPSMSRPAS